MARREGRIVSEEAGEGKEGQTSMNAFLTRPTTGGGKKRRRLGRFCRKKRRPPFANVGETHNPHVKIPQVRPIRKNRKRKFERDRW